MDSYMGNELSDGDLLSDVLLRTAGKTDFQNHFQRKENCLTKDPPVIQKYNSQYATKQINQRFCAADFDCFPACFRKQAAKCDPAAKTNGGSQCIHRQVINVCYP